MELDYIENGLTKKNGRRKTRKRRRNPAAARATARTTAKRRNGTTKAGAMSFLKKNGLKAVSRTAQNGRRKHHKRKKRNGIVTASRRNGILGNTKQDAKQVGALLAGMGVTKVAGRIINNFLAPYAAQMGLGAYSGILADGLVALVAVPWLGGKVLGKDGATFGRLGGLGVVAMDIIDAVAPNALGQFNPFNNSAVVLQGGQPLLTPAAVTAIVASSDASPAQKNALAGAMRQLENGGDYEPLGSGYNQVSQLARWD